MIYLNHAGTSWPKPEAVQTAVSEAMSGNPMEWPELFEVAHKEIAAYFGLATPERLLLTPGCTSALAVAVADHDWQPGDVVLTSSWEHHALFRPLTKLMERGVSVEIVPSGVGNALDLSLLEKRLTRGDVRLVAVTAACNVTGELLPFEKIVQLCQRYEVLSLIDAAQIVGWIDLDLPSLGADLIAFGGHKGLQAPWGVGALYVREGVVMSSPSASCELPPPGEEWSCGVMPGYCDVGSVDQVALAGLQAAVKWLEQECSPDRLRIAQHQIAQIQGALGQRRNVTVYGSSDSERRLPTIAFGIEGQSSSEIATTFRKAGLIVGSGLQCAPQAHQTLGTEQGGVARISIGLTTSNSEIEETLKLINRVG